MDNQGSAMTTCECPQLAEKYRPCSACNPYVPPANPVLAGADWLEGIGQDHAASMLRSWNNGDFGPDAGTASKQIEVASGATAADPRAAIARVREQCAEWAGPSNSKSWDAQIRDSIAASCAEMILQALAGPAATVTPKEAPAHDAPILPRAFPHIEGRCPACGRTGLFLGEGGYVTCPHSDCPDPCAATTLLHAARGGRESAVADRVGADQDDARQEPPGVGAVAAGVLFASGLPPSSRPAPDGAEGHVVTAPAESPAALLRRAADRLNERGGAATEGPWFAHEQADYDCGFEATVGTGNGQSIEDKTNIIGHGYEGGGAHNLADAEYIATVDPLVGRAFAGMLRAAAAMATGLTQADGIGILAAAMTAARKILGEDS